MNSIFTKIVSELIFDKGSLKKSMIDIFVHFLWKTILFYGYIIFSDKINKNDQFCISLLSTHMIHDDQLRCLLKMANCTSGRSDLLGAGGWMPVPVTVVL